MERETKVIDILVPRIKELVEGIRPPADLRDQLDIGFSYENNVLEIMEVRPKWSDPENKMKMPVAKAQYIKSKGHWKVFWMRGSGNWESYEPNPTAKDLENFFAIIDEDKHSCFWG